MAPLVVVFWLLHGLDFQNGNSGCPDSSSLDPHPTHQTKKLKEIAVDYYLEVCDHLPEFGEIFVTFDQRGGARWRSKKRFRFGTFSALLQCPQGITNSLNFNIYLSSLDGDKSQDEINFEFLGKDETIVQTIFYTNGVGSSEQIHHLGFDSSDGFHKYKIKWSPIDIEWWVEGEMVRKAERIEGEGFHVKPMSLYASLWTASYIDEGRWTGNYVVCDTPYVCRYRDVHVPTTNDGDWIRIFDGIMNEFHSSATRKSKEWQEKLHIEVLEAEEIMHPKPNLRLGRFSQHSLIDKGHGDIFRIQPYFLECQETGDCISLEHRS